MKCDHARAVASTSLVQDQTVWCCRECRHVRLDGASTWIRGGGGVVDQLRAMAGNIALEQTNYQQMLDSPIEDRRWTRLD
jgi:hypothetical protein